MSRWFRFYDSVLDDPKVQRLSDSMFRAWVNLLCLAARNAGDIEKHKKDIAFALRIRAERVDKILETLISAGLLDDHETVVRPHNWDNRQYISDVSTERVKRFRKRERNVSETPPDTEQNRTERGTFPRSPGRAAETPRKTDESWLGKEAPIIARVGEDDFAVWLAPCRLVTERPLHVVAPSKFYADTIVKKLAVKLSSLGGEPTIEVAAQQ